MKQFLFLELSMFNFTISLDYKNRLKSIYWFLSIIKLFIKVLDFLIINVNFDFTVKRLTNS